VAPQHVELVVVVVRGDVEVARWSMTTGADLGLVDELARLQLRARRLGCAIEVRGATTEVDELLELAGLVGAMASGVEVGGEAEGGEEVGVEEAVLPDDPVA
jgi:hypothetical protein